MHVYKFFSSFVFMSLILTVISMKCDSTDHDERNCNSYLQRKFWVRVVVKGFDVINMYLPWLWGTTWHVLVLWMRSVLFTRSTVCLFLFFLHFAWTILLGLSARGSSVLPVDLGRNKTASAGVGLEIVKLPYTGKPREKHLQVIQEV